LTSVTALLHALVLLNHDWLCGIQTPAPSLGSPIVPSAMPRFSSYERSRQKNYRQLPQIFLLDYVGLSLLWSTSTYDPILLLCYQNYNKWLKAGVVCQIERANVTLEPWYAVGGDVMNVFFLELTLGHRLPQTPTHELSGYLDS
jgi:hypothetical protein